MSEVAEPINPYDGFKMLRDHAPVTQIEADGPRAVGFDLGNRRVVTQHLKAIIRIDGFCNFTHTCSKYSGMAICEQGLSSTELHRATPSAAGDRT